MEKNLFIILVANIVDDLLVTGDAALVDNFIRDHDVRFKLESVAHRPGSLRFIGMNITQEEMFS